EALALGEIGGQHAPLDPAFGHIKDGIEHGPHTEGTRSSTAFSGWDQLFDPLPFLVGQVAWIDFFVHLPIVPTYEDFSDRLLGGWVGAIPPGYPAREETCRKVTRLAPTHQGVGNRPFYRWLTRVYRALFPRLPERTRLFRLLKTHQAWTKVFLAAPTVLGVIDTYGIELIHPIREGRSPQQIGRKGVSNHRWIVGGKLCLLLNQWGLIVGWDCATANVADNTFPGRADGYQTG